MKVEKYSYILSRIKLTPETRGPVSSFCVTALEIYSQINFHHWEHNYYYIKHTPRARYQETGTGTGA